MIKIYCDGSGKGGAIALAVDEKENVLSYEYTFNPGITSNMAEYQGIINAIQLIKKKGFEDQIIVYTDSQLVYGQLFNGWKCNVFKLEGSILFVKNFIEYARIHDIKVGFKQIPRELNIADPYLTKMQRGYKLCVEAVK